MIRMIEITDFHAPELDIFARKTEAQLLNKDHPEEGMFIAESPKVIERALNAGYTPVAVLVEKKQIEGEAASVLARCDEIPVYTAEFDVLAQLTGFKLTRGMLCAMRRRGLPEVEKVCQNAKKVAVLENVMNPTNVGAIFSFCRSFKYGCSTSDRRMQQSIVSQSKPCQYGDGVSDSVDIYRRKAGRLD